MTEIEAVLYDMDGVLASVGNSYREAIVLTAARFGVTVTQDDITSAKKLGNSNNDWILTRSLIEMKRGSLLPSLEEVTSVFEEIYQGTSEVKGLCETETLIPSIGLLTEVFKRCNGKTAVVTGRPKKDCQKFLETHKIAHLFPISICMEDVPAKPDPSGVLLAASRLNINPANCVMIGDTPDDIKAGKAAGTLAWGVLTPEEDAKIILDLMKVEDGMTSRLKEVGADGIMKVGLGDLLDIIPPLYQRKKNSEMRYGKVSRSTKETEITAKVWLDGTGKSEIHTGIGFLDHMFSQLSKHGRFDITLQCKGDLHIDDHHTAEDCALALGEAFDLALGTRAGIRRFGQALCPLDEALSRVVVDISSRPHSVIDLQFTREMIGTISCEMIQHVLESFATTCRITLHVHNLHGVNNHHKAESAFKALGVALRSAVEKDSTAGIPSTKGLL